MTLPTKTTFTVDWTTFADVLTPGAYTAAQLKALFNERDQELLDFINSILAVLISTVAGSSGSENIGAATIAGVSGNTTAAQIADLRAQIVTIIGGAIPPSSVTTAMIQNLAVTAAKIALATITAAQLAPNSITYANADVGTQMELLGGFNYAYKNGGYF